MKRIFPLILILLALWGCGTDSESPGEPAVPGEISPGEPTGFYEPGSELETATGGAVQVYPLDRSDCSGMLPMGEDILLFSGAETTTLTKVSGSNLYITATADLDCAISPDDPGVQVSEKGVTFYDVQHHELVFLDTGLKEVSRFSLPEDILGSPTLSADRKNLYYCTVDSLRVLDLETGFHKLLKEMFFPEQSVRGLHFDGTVVECSVVRNDGAAISYFFSTETGETLWEAMDELALTTNGQSYFAVHSDGAYREMLVGTSDIGPYALYFDDIHTAALPLLEHSAVTLCSFAEDNGAVTLHYFDLDSGKRTAQLELPGGDCPRSIHGDSTGGVWMLRYDKDYGCDTVYRWNPRLCETGDEGVYVASRFTYENPDTEGLERCRQTADALSEKFDVNIRIWTDAVSQESEDYILTAEYQVPIIEESLEELEQALSRYPEGFLKKAAKGTSSGAIQICLVRSADGRSGYSPESSSGIQFWSRDEDAYICLIAGPGLEQNLHHELFHIIENRVMSTCSAYDGWDELNPAGFRYDYEYISYQYREDATLLEGENRAFIDMFSMSFPKEDRARIMEYAMMIGCEDYFQSPVMQSKLRQLCIGIRKAFKLEESPESFRWEQYLDEPLA